MVNKIIMRLAESNAEGSRHIGKYTYSPKQSIGKGYSSVVYSGREEPTGQTVAVKVIDTKNMKGQVHRTLLNNQIEILRLLSNLQNVILLHDIIPQKSQTYIITELCEGGDLAKTIKNKRKIDQTEAITILKQIINGYRGINRFGIVHRDLKPANIFFNDGKVKIADFGFAIRNSDLKRGTNYNVGSPVYMPLQALNENLYSPKSDVWAIGVIFYEMLTGHTPWRAKTQNDLKRQIKAVSIKALLPTNISRLSAEFLTKALQVNVGLRMSPEQMVRHFQSGMDDLPEQASSVLRTNYLLRTRAISQQQTDRVVQQSTKIDKVTVTAPKTFRKVSRIKEKQFVKLPQPAAKLPREFQDGLFQRLTGEIPKIGNLARTVAAIGGEWMPDHKKTSTHLLSQIHLCRFLYKLIERMDTVDLQTDKLRSLMGGVIKGKLGELKQMTMINPKYAIIFRRTRENEKIQQIVTQYQQKYLEITSQCLSYHQSLGEIDFQITKEIARLYNYISESSSLEGKEDHVILLDYFITMKQLFVLNGSNDIEYFHKKSKIEAIVEGKPARNITDDHVQAITNKLKLFKIIQ